MIVEILIRRARTADVRSIRQLVDMHSGQGRRLLAKSTVTLREEEVAAVVIENRCLEKTKVGAHTEEHVIDEEDSDGGLFGENNG